MNVEKARLILGLVGGEDQAEVEEQFEALLSDVERKLGNAPTNALKQKYRKRRREIEDAYEAIVEGQSDSLPSTAPTEARPATAPIPGEAQASRKSPEEPIGFVGAGAYRESGKVADQPLRSNERSAPSPTEPMIRVEEARDATQPDANGRYVLLKDFFTAAIVASVCSLLVYGFLIGQLVAEMTWVGLLPFPEWAYEEGGLSSHDYRWVNGATAEIASFLPAFFIAPYFFRRSLKSIVRLKCVEREGPLLISLYVLSLLVLILFMINLALGGSDYLEAELRFGVLAISLFMMGLQFRPGLLANQLNLDGDSLSPSKVLGAITTLLMNPVREAIDPIRSSTLKSYGDLKLPALAVGVFLVQAFIYVAGAQERSEFRRDFDTRSQAVEAEEGAEEAAEEPAEGYDYASE